MIDQWKKGAKYWDHAWNPVIGCRPVSEACENCYAEAFCKRFDMNGDGGFSPTVKKKVPRLPRQCIVFVGNMTDIFGEWNTDEQIYEWLDARIEGECCAEYLVLTKRVKRFREYQGVDAYYEASIHFGMTAENQQRYDERIKDFCLVDQMSAWLSLEPLLGEVDMTRCARFYHWPDTEEYSAPSIKRFNWVVVGAESGKNRRPCKIEWVESVVEQCLHYKVPVFVKQLDMGGKLVTDIGKFPEHLQIRQVPWKSYRQVPWR